jgi:hypothetical protein
MEAWMEYAYQQQIKPTNATGVPVNIDVLDSNGNYRNIGTTTSDANGQFSFTWTPDIPGDYTVTTSFLGTESYYPSSAEAFFTVSEPVATPLPTATTEGVATTNDLMMYLVPSVLAIIIAIAIVGVVIVMTLRKRP